MDNQILMNEVTNEGRRAHAYFNKMTGLNIAFGTSAYIVTQTLLGTIREGLFSNHTGYWECRFMAFGDYPELAPKIFLTAYNG